MKETVEIECPKCKNKMRIHQPKMVVHHDVDMSQVSLIPSWSEDERACRGCGCVIGPLIQNINWGYACYEPVEKPRVQLADASALKRLKAI